MKKVIALAALFLAFSAVGTPTGTHDDDTEVYVCTGRSSECYHSIEDCRGLKFCNGQVRKVSLSAAQTLGRRECKICHKN